MFKRLQIIALELDVSCLQRPCEGSTRSCLLYSVVVHAHLSVTISLDGITNDALRGPKDEVRTNDHIVSVLHPRVRYGTSARSHD